MKLIDADTLFEFVQKEKAWKQGTMKYPRYEQGKYDAFYEMLDIIKEQPAVDAIPVVHCKDCRYLGIKGLGDGYCNKKMAGIISPYDFCSYGERRDGK